MKIYKFGGYIFIIVALVVSIGTSIFFTKRIVYNKIIENSLIDAIFCLDQYGEHTDMNELYYSALGEVGAIINVSTYDNSYIDNEEEKIKFLKLYTMLIKESEFCQQHYAQISEILKRVKNQDDRAYIEIDKLEELMNKNHNNSLTSMDTS